MGLIPSATSLRTDRSALKIKIPMDLSLENMDISILMASSKNLVCRRFNAFLFLLRDQY